MLQEEMMERMSAREFVTRMLIQRMDAVPDPNSPNVVHEQTPEQMAQVIELIALSQQQRKARQQDGEL